MSNLLNDIYYAATEGIEMPPVWKKKIAKASQAYDEFSLQLSPATRALYDTWERAQGEVTDEEMHTIFFQGVKLGLALGLLS